VGYTLAGFIAFHRAVLLKAFLHKSLITILSLWRLHVYLRHLEHGCDADLIPDAKLLAMKSRKAEQNKSDAEAKKTKTSVHQNWYNQGTAELAHINAYNKLPASRSSQRQGWYNAGQLLESVVQAEAVRKDSHIKGGDIVFFVARAPDGGFTGNFGFVMTCWRRGKKNALPTTRPLSKDICSFARVAVMDQVAAVEPVAGLCTLHVRADSKTQIVDGFRVLVNFELPVERLRLPKGLRLRRGEGVSAILNASDAAKLQDALKSKEIQASLDKLRPMAKKRRRKKGGFKVKAPAKALGKMRKYACQKRKAKKVEELLADAELLAEPLADDPLAVAEPLAPAKKAKAAKTKSAASSSSSGAVSLDVGKAPMEDNVDNYDRYGQGQKMLRQRLTELLAIDVNINGLEAAAVDIHTGDLRISSGVSWKYIHDGIQSYMNNLYPKGTGPTKLKPNMKFAGLEAALKAGNSQELSLKKSTMIQGLASIRPQHSY
jgi:hypothetical protein